MKITCAFLLVGFLCTQLPSASSMPPKDKVGTCPSPLSRCLKPGKHECNIDYDCDGILKCCYRYCSKICQYPIAKPGRCPYVKIRCMMANPPNKCDHDVQCEGREKCCEGTCGRTCIPPVPLTVE
ncbi:antileukoproteinase-like [Pantherophis guttatus]|uniref:Antileukoproteinase-like n=1 Tax=Pantherophis guttatus TaxID=94885 RepID=A0ABM3ZAY8_PANGU|nr:antileukoproteinase-like [Pantherophis guttatus]